MLKQFLLILLVFLYQAPLNAQQEQSLAVLKERIESYLLNQLANNQEGKININTDKIDPRLHLKQCADDKLEVFNPYQATLSGSTTLGIRCLESDNHWSLYVPARISIQKPVIAAKQAILKGQVIGENDIQLLEMDISQLKQGYYIQTQQVLGLVAKQNIHEGNCLLPSTLENATLVHKGQQVNIIAINDSIKVSMPGVALGSGSVNDLIKVKNLSSDRTVEARVSGQNEVHVAL